MKLGDFFVKRRTLKHWRRMINAAKSFAEQEEALGVPPYRRRELPDSGKMLRVTAETWTGKYCDYCEKYIHKMCPLRLNLLIRANQVCNGCGCCDGRWSVLNESNTWREWIMRAERIYNFIKING